MPPPARLDAALKRLNAALGQLEAAGAHAARTAVESRDLADTLAVMQDDRGRLADELDAALARTEMLERTTDEVAARLDRAGVTLRQLIDEADGPLENRAQA